MGGKFSYNILQNGVVIFSCENIRYVSSKDRKHKMKVIAIANLECKIEWTITPTVTYGDIYPTICKEVGRNSYRLDLYEKAMYSEKMIKKARTIERKKQQNGRK